MCLRFNGWSVCNKDSYFYGEDDQKAAIAKGFRGEKINAPISAWTHTDAKTVEGHEKCLPVDDQWNIKRAGVGGKAKSKKK